MKQIFILFGKPIPKKRPRFTKRGNFVQTYNCQKKEEDNFRRHLKCQFKTKPLSCPLIIDFEFVFDRPKSHYGTGRNSKTLKATSPDFHVVKPDKDNLEKFALDCMEGVVFNNDSQVFSGTTTKRYALEGEEAQTIISIETGGKEPQKIISIETI